MQASKRNAFRKSTAKLFIIVGNTPGDQNSANGKDLIIQAVDSMGALHAEIIPKYTSRGKKSDDGNEMICNCTFAPNEDGTYDVNAGKEKVQCDIVYSRKGNMYGFNSKEIWNGLKRGMFQVVVISEVETINRLREIFGGLVILIYVHSHNWEKPTEDGQDDEQKVAEEFKLYSQNFDVFNHVLIYEDKAEDLYDQMFRLFKAYEKNMLVK